MKTLKRFSGAGRVAVLLSLMGFASLLQGQGGLGSIAGRVIDPSGGALAGAQVRAINLSTNIKTETRATDAGYYQIQQLNPGAYILEAEAPGFKKLVRDNIVVQVSDRLSLDLTLAIGNVAESITVSAKAALLRTEDAQTGEVINGTMIHDLPQLNRDPTQLLTLSGNVQGSGGRAQSGSDTRINGGRTVGVEYIVDGISAGTGLGHNVVNTIPTMETVAEFKVITNGISAEYGRLSGGAVELVTKSGTNGLHGEGFEYFQNDHLNANSWSQNAQGGTKVKFAQNIFGAALGGPIRIPKLYNGRDRSFFTFNYEGNRRRQAGSLQTISVPTEMERGGDLTQTVYNGISPVVYDQNGTVTYDAATNTYTRQTLMGGDGKHIPASQIDPVSKALLLSVPLPNRAARAGTNAISNYTAPQNSQSSGDRWSFRLDHLFTSSHRTSFRYNNLASTSGNTPFAGPASVASQSRSKGAFGVLLNHDWTASPTLLVNVRLGANHYPYSSGNQLPAGFSSANIPLDSVTKSLLGDHNVPDVTLSNGSQLAYAASGSVTNSTTYDTAIGVTRIFNRHTLKLGFDLRRYYDNYYGSGSGTFRFDAAGVTQTAGVDYGYGSDISNAYTMASYLLGITDRNLVSGATTRANAFNYYAGYVQDDFHVTPKLTLNLGLRWDMESPVTERHDKLYVWDPNAPSPFTINPGYNFASAVTAAGLDPASVVTPAWVSGGMPNGAVRIANTPEYKSRNATEYHPWNFAPRLGMAYQLGAKTVARASFGQMYISTSGAAGAFSTGGGGITLASAANAGWHASTDNMVHIFSTFQHPWLPGVYSEYVRTNAAANLQATNASGPSAFSMYSHMPYELTWSLGLQRELPFGLLGEVTYSANAGRGLLGPDITSRFPSKLFSGGPAGQNARMYTTQVASPTAGQTQTNATVGPQQNLGILEYLYPYFGPIAVQGANIGTSNFGSVNFRLEKRLNHGTSFLINYTFSKSLDDVGGPDTGAGTGVSGTNLGGKRTQTVDNTPAMYGVSPLDETHVVRATYIVQLPVGRGRHFLGHPDSIATSLLDRVAGGWELAGTGNYRSGRPVILQATTPNINNNVRVEWTYGSYASTDSNIVDSRFNAPSQVFYSTRDARPTGLVRRFANVADAKVFTYGTLPPVFGNVRHPGQTQYDLSLMKSFYFTGERKQYLQFRMEGNNIFNIRGFGSYNTTIGTQDFGLITAAGNTERHIQVSARIIF